jgi:hypothetical protein
MRLTRAQLQADIDFLVMRANAAGCCDFTNDRWTGLSSNSLVNFAFGGKHDCMPSDRSDYAACVRTFRRLPAHRRTRAVVAALARAKEAYLKHYPAERFPGTRRAERERMERERQEWLRSRRRERRGRKRRAA